MKQLISLLLIICANWTFSQTPSHFFLGSDIFSGVHIYDLIEDHDLNYWIATDNGIYKYDGYEFKHYDCEDMVSISVFNLCLDSKNNLYCHNLSGQIFQIVNDTCSLYYQIPDSLVSTQIELTINSYDQIIIITQYIFELHKDKSIGFISEAPIYQGECTISNDGATFAIGYQKETPSGILSTFRIEGDRIKKSILYPAAELEVSNYVYPISIDNQSFFVGRDNSSLFKIEGDTFKLQRSFIGGKLNTGVYFENDELWLMQPSLGIYQIKNYLNDSIQEILHFDDYKVSAFIEDHEGNKLLGTFNYGIIVVPTTQIVNIDLGQYNGKINQICKSNSRTIAFGTVKGEIGFIDKLDEVKRIHNAEVFQIESMFFIPSSNSFIIGTRLNAIFDIETEKVTADIAFGTLKDLENLPKGQSIIATNVGVYIFNSNGAVIDVFSNNYSHIEDKNYVKIYDGRTYSVNFDSINKTVYIGSSTGLKLLNKSGIQEIKRDGKEILCKDILYLDKKIYVTTTNFGILIFENDRIIENWTKENYLISNSAKWILTDNEYIYISLDEGIQILNKVGETQGILDKSDGLYSDRIIDMELFDGDLWVLQQKGLQKVNLKSLEQNNFTPQIKFEQIQLFEHAISIEDEHSFSHLENKFTFEFSSKSIKYQNEIHFQYRLVGLDVDFQRIPHSQNKVMYKSLPPGEYSFEINANYREQSSETISYSFLIKAAFWKELWFIIVMVLTLILIVFLYFNWQIKKQKKASLLQKELYESKLTAIQAQMNPHFIFNSLNSIQDLVLKNDAENAYIYISKFAHLVRNTLNQSDKDFIDFKDEIASLKLYLTLEKLRFKESFDYSIQTEENDIQIPPMLIQPFIENSLIHGLLHKDGAKRILINFHLEDSLICTITDNGIGREEAKLIQKRQYINHESFALKAILKRLEILQVQYGGKFEVKYIDLYENGVPSGTQVILKIPFLRAY